MGGGGGGGGGGGKGGLKGGGVEAVRVAIDIHHKPGIFI